MKEMRKPAIVTLDDYITGFQKGFSCDTMRRNEKTGKFVPTGEKTHLNNHTQVIVIRRQRFEIKLANSFKKFSDHFIAATPSGFVSIHRNWLRTPDGKPITRKFLDDLP